MQHPMRPQMMSSTALTTPLLFPFASWTWDSERPPPPPPAASEKAVKAVRQARLELSGRSTPDL